METEEIEKAAQVESDELVVYYSKYDFKRGFHKGVEFSDKHWQEKTRWIPVEERLPAFEGKRRTILVKTGDDLYSFLWIIQEVSLSDFECQGYTHWKEIELC